MNTSSRIIQDQTGPKINIDSIGIWPTTSVNKSYELKLNSMPVKINCI